MTKKSNIQAGTAWLAVMLIFIGLVFGTKAYFETNARLDSMESMQISFSKHLGEKSVVIIDLEKIAAEQETSNNILIKRLEANHQYMNDIAARAYDNSIDIDEISYEGIEVLIGEIWDYIKVLEKRVKYD